MLRTLGLISILVAGSLLSVPTTASAFSPASSAFMTGSMASNIETVRLHRRMRHMRRGNPSAQGWKKNF